jgi:hypothetical protein
MKNQGGSQYNMTFFQKNYVLNHLKSLRGWWSSSLNQIDILIIFLFKMLLFFFLFSEKSPPWLNMYVFRMCTKVTF